MARDSLYQILGVDPKASMKEIREAFLVQAQRYHPDLHSSESLTDARFKEIREAYEVLHNPKRRAIYDNELLLRFGDDPFGSESDFTTTRLKASSFKPIWLDDFNLVKERLLLFSCCVVTGIMLACIWSFAQSRSSHQTSGGVKNSVGPHSETTEVNTSSTLAASVTNHVVRDEADDEFNKTLLELKKKKELRAETDSAIESDAIYPYGTSDFVSIFESTESINASLPMYPSVDYESVAEEIEVSDDYQSMEPIDPTVGDFQSFQSILPSAGDPNATPTADLSSTFDIQRSVWQTQVPTRFAPVPSQASLSTQPLRPELPVQSLVPNNTQMRPSQFTPMPMPAHRRASGTGLIGVPTFSNSVHSAAPMRSNFQRLPVPAVHEPSRSYSTGTVIPHYDSSTTVSPTTPVLPSMIPN